ncbi:type II toxin-antitoxin system HicA family toxin [Planktothricoides raciborskii]|nr:type II toxin-antitoxin system HicA family toxin [Planktothricoides raciborskii]
MKLPRDLSGQDLVKSLKIFGYEVSHQTGSHIRLTTQQQGEHHITIPAHNP